MWLVLAERRLHKTWPWWKLGCQELQTGERWHPLNNQKSSPSTSKINGTSNFQSWLTQLQIRFYKVSCETFRLWCNNWFMRQRAFIEIWSTREVYRARKMHKSCSRHSSGLDDAMESDNDDDTLTFLRAVTTRSGKAVQLRYFSEEVS